MRIAFFTDDYMPYIHGVTRSIQSYREALEKRGHEVFVVAPNHPDYIDNDDHIIRTKSINSYIFEKRPMSILYPGMAKKFDKYHFDIVHTQTQFWLGTLGYMVAKRQNIPHISTMHTIFPELVSAYPLAVISGLLAVSIGYPIAYKTTPVHPFSDSLFSSFRTSNRELLDRQAWKLVKIFMAHTSRCIAPSKHISETLIKHGITPMPDVLANGVDTAFYRQVHKFRRLKKQQNERWIVSVGRLSAEKRQKVLIDALALMKDQHVRLVLVGDGPDYAELLEQAHDAGIAERVSLTGNLTRSEVAAILQQADIFTIASYHFDNQPMTILEALACGVPIVYADERLTEGLTSENALLTTSPKPESFCVAFEKLLKDPQKLKNMSVVASKLALDYDISTQAAQLEKLYLTAAPVDKHLSRK